MKKKQLAQCKIELEAGLRQLLQGNPECQWLKKILDLETNELEQFLSSLYEGC
jgi:hypothetical protein